MIVFADSHGRIAIAHGWATSAAGFPWVGVASSQGGIQERRACWKCPVPGVHKFPPWDDKCASWPRLRLAAIEGARHC